MASGIVVSFDLHKGFGFIRSAEYREDVFVHITAVDGRKALKSGQRVEFVAEPTDKGPRATRVVPGRVGLSPTMSAFGLLVAILLGVTGGLHKAGVGWVGAYLGAIWLATWIAYAWDKRRAGRDERRVPEAALLGLALIGGSPAAAIAMFVLRHKTRKPAFLIPFACVIAAQVVAVVAWARWG
ncbi:DUF1294 domain-containing protein [Tundrisphaera lichenicola]|uniref:DUF1294 domain-containing protein n=1 Tax=Tundrisphaera lichenicola TaxID=2029860 RepID=UPI003EBFDA03